MNRLAGKTVVITGANSGVGEAAALLFAAEGANVVLGARRVEPLQAVEEKIRANGGKAVAVATDISKDEDCKAIVKAAVDNFGGIDVLVNNAGVLDTGLKSVDKYLDSDMDKVVAINQTGTIQCIRAALAEMKQGASIVNVASVAGINGGGGAAYVASKAAIVGITKHTALLCAAKGIRCNVVCPGNIMTPMTAGMNQTEMDMEMMGAMAKHCDLRGVPFCKAEDVANILLFLAADESKAITGQAIVSDFGSSL